MIDTNELRRLAQAAMHPVTKGRWMRLFGERTVYDRMEDGCRGIPVVSTPVSPPHPFEAACLDFIAAANPAVVIEILDRLEAAESEALEQARLNGMGAEREAALLAKLEAAEKDIAIKEEVIDSLATVIKRLDAQCDAAEKERDDFAQQLLQSEIGKREISEAHDALQVEVGKLKDLEVSRCVKINGYIVDNARLAEEVERLRAKIAEMERQEPVATVIKEGDSRYWMSERLWTLPDGKYPLYALPGAKGE